jgi:anti-sigma factor RsiW
MSEHWTDRLSEYLDGELSPNEAVALESHVATCAACRLTLQELRQVIGAAATLEDAPPATDLWPGILEKMIAGDGATVLPFRAPDRPTRRLTFSVSQLAAAAAILMFLSGGSVWMLSRMAGNGAGTQTASAPAVTEPQTPSEIAARFVTTTQASYEGAIQELESMLAANRDRLDPATVQVVERNLATIDAAIAEAKAALSNDPSNAYLYKHFDNTLMKKIELLRRATSLPRTET